MTLDATMNTAKVLLIDESEAPPMHRNIDTGPMDRFRIMRKPTLLQGLEALTKSPFEVVLLGLPLSGVSTTESITRTLKVAGEVPVIAFVNEGETTRAAEALLLGAHDYVFKGCHCDAVVRTLRYAIKRKQLIAEREHARRQVTRNGALLVAHMSHEFRNSLACIHQFGNILIDGLAGELSGQQREYLGIILENSRNVGKLLEEATRVKSGTA